MSTKEPAEYTDPTAWTITRELPPPDLWPVIRDAYILPLQTLWYLEGIALIPSLHSCYRPKWYERSKGRSGNSLHCFPAGTLGACDITLADGAPVIHVLDRVIEELPFRRICVYRGHNFLHVDYGEQGRRSGDRRSLWECATITGQWVRRSDLPELGR